MGYYTVHRLTIVSGDDNVTDYAKEISKLSGYDDCFDDEIKWYNHIEDMTAFSLLHPDTVFLIDGDGEDSGDIWKQWFKNGKNFISKMKMVFEEFNESKLK